MSEPTDDTTMKLLFVTDSVKGTRMAGCRAEGIHRGIRIEKTAWCPFESFPIHMKELEIIATNKYKQEVSIIDNLEIAKSN